MTVLVLLPATPALAAPSCTTVAPVLGQTVTCTYAAGGATTIAVPVGARSISLVVRGGGGAGGESAISIDMGGGAAGGNGARVTASVQSTSLTAVTVVVGASGTYSGGGGGFSAVYSGSSTSAVFVIAGGGGGGVSINNVSGVGGDGAATSAAGASGGNVSELLPGGAGGTGGTGGAGGAGQCGSTTLSGMSWVAGGAGGARTLGSGGGGGGGYGGGGEGCGAGGGAGGSYIDPSRIIGTATYSPTGGTGGTRLNSTPSSAGSVSLTFIAQTYVVTYDANGASGGTAPVDASSPYTHGATATVLGNTGDLVRFGYRFTGWSTGTVVVLAGDTLVITTDTTFQAQWESLPAPEATAAPPPTTTAVITLRTTRPKASALGAIMTFTAPGAGTATTTGALRTRSGTSLCRGRVKVKRAGTTTIRCNLTAAGRRMRARQKLVLTLTTVFITKNGQRSTSTKAVTLPRRR